jgi:hypothetical protein
MPTAQIAHLPFAHANANTQNCKRAILPNAPVKQEHLNIMCENYLEKRDKKINLYI